MNIFKSPLPAAIFLLFILSCKDDKDETTTPVVMVPPGIVCTGNGADTYYPLAINNTWTFPKVAVNSPSYHDYVISNTAVFDSVTYFVLYDTDGHTDSYLRKASNGDIMRYVPSAGAEFLAVPASPSNGQSWNYAFSLTRRVIATSTPVTTEDCQYDQCLLLEDFYANGQPHSKHYYRKGIGPVSFTIPGMGITFNLHDLELH